MAVVRAKIDPTHAEDHLPAGTSRDAHMKIRTLAAGIAAVATAGAAAAQDLTINEYIRGLLADMTDGGSTLVGEIAFNEIEEGESASHTFTLDPAKAYMVYAACDDDCFHLDMLGEDADGAWVDEDLAEDDVPILIVLPGESGDSLTVTVEMAACAADTCVYGIGLYKTEF